MKKLLLTILVIIGLQAQGQIVITQAEMPFAGDELYRTRAINNPFLNYSATGPNHVWNFSNLVANTQDSAIFQTVASTNFVYALVYADIFFNPNRANHARAGVDIPFSNLLPISDPYTFFYRSSSIYKKVGYGAELAGIPLPIIYTDHDEIYSLPLNYSDTDSTFSAYNITIPTLAYYGYEQRRLNNVDGWGVITTPQGTFDVLRVKTTLIGRDTVQLDSLSLGFVIDRPVVNEYKWLANGIRVPVMQVNTTTILGFEIITDIFFYDDPRTISVIQPLASVLCPGQSIQINYDATGTFNPGGFLSSANVFRAQLSDISGSFAAPVNIGSVTSQISGVINATIPVNTVPGSGYRIRVISTNPAFIGSDNGFDLTIGLFPSATIAASGPTEFCDGDSVLLTSGTDPSYAYQWQLNGTDITGATLSELIVHDAGNYNVIITNACGSSISSALPVSVNDLPEHTFTQSGFVSCNGAAVMITSQNTTGQTALSYQWYLDGILLAGETNPDITSSLPGNYYLEIFNTLTGCAYTTTQVQVIADIFAEPIISANSTTTFCDGGSVLLEIVPEPSVNYQWYVDGIIIPGATGSDFTALNSGTYTVLATSVNGCTALSGTGIVITVNALPNAVAVTTNGPTTFCQGSSALLEFVPEPGVVYQWQLDGVDITGATSNSLIVTVGGLYTVIPTSPNGCIGAVSNNITIYVEPLPISPVITSTSITTICDGGSALLEIIPEPGISYQWYVDGVPILGAIDSIFSASIMGNYTVQATSLAGCTSLSVNGIDIIVNPLPVSPVITANGNTIFCEGGSVTLEVPQQTGISYQWTLNNIALIGATGYQYTVTTGSGFYNVNVTDTNGCSTVAIMSNQVVINPLPAVPVITQSYDTLFASGTGPFQWYLNGNPISGATSSYVVALVNGSYTVMVSDVNGCENVSVVYPFNSVGIMEYQTFETLIYPNPSSGIFNVIFNIVLTDPISYTLFDNAGRIVESGFVTGKKLAIDISEKASGIYLLRLQAGSIESLVKLSKL